MFLVFCVRGSLAFSLAVWVRRMSNSMCINCFQRTNNSLWPSRVISSFECGMSWRHRFCARQKEMGKRMKNEHPNSEATKKESAFFLLRLWLNMLWPLPSLLETKWKFTIQNLIVHGWRLRTAHSNSKTKSQQKKTLRVYDKPWLCRCAVTANRQKHIIFDGEERDRGEKQRINKWLTIITYRSFCSCSMPNYGHPLPIDIPAIARPIIIKSHHRKWKKKTYENCILFFFFIIISFIFFFVNIFIELNYYLFKLALATMLAGCRCLVKASFRCTYSVHAAALARARTCTLHKFQYIKCVMATITLRAESIAIYQTRKVRRKAWKVAGKRGKTQTKKTAQTWFLMVLNF